MTDGHDPDRPQEGGRPILRALLAVAVAIALGALLAWWLHPRPPAAPPATAGPATVPAPTTEAPATEPAPAPAPRASRREAEPAKPVETAPPPASAAAKPVVRVTSDVDGAFVFVDRRFLGKTPLETTDVSSGHHQLNVSADGYDGVSEGLDVPDTGSTDVHVALKTVRLNASVDVVHKHGIGSCDGHLVATVDGLRYETSNSDDAFTLRFDQIEAFSLDYKEKNLRVKKRGGRTWNFTRRDDNADALLVFTREVDKARAKLARQGAAR